MSESTPGPSSSVQLVQKPTNSKPKKLELCLICQRVKDSKGCAKLTSTDDGRKVIIDTSEKLDDGLVANIKPIEQGRIQYHVKTCYSKYKKQGERHEKAQKRNAEDEPEVSPVTSPVTRAKRAKSIVSPEPKDKPCIICNFVKHQGELQRFRIESPEVANRMLKAVNFNKDIVHTRMIFMKEIGDIFANDVMYHRNCMNKYINQFERDVEKLLADDFESEKQSNHVKEAFTELVATLDIGLNGYAISEIRDTLNKELKNKKHGELSGLPVLSKLRESVLP